MAHYWITGARGFIGRHLARWLAQQGHKVVGVGHGSWSPESAKQWGVSSWIEGELVTSNLDQLLREDTQPDVIFHLAGGASVVQAINHPDEDYRKTVVATATLLEWIWQRTPEARLVAVSSAAVYGAGHDGAISENATLNPFSPYGEHKRRMEELCLGYASKHGMRVVLPRLFSVYGPELKKQLLWDLCCKIVSATSITLGGTGAELRDWTSVQDVVRLLDLTSILASDQAPALNLATGVGTSVREIATFVVNAWDAAGAKEVVFNGQTRAGDPFSLIADVSALKRSGTACTITVQQGIPEYIRWFQRAQATS